MHKEFNRDAGSIPLDQEQIEYLREQFWLIAQSADPLLCPVVGVANVSGYPDLLSFRETGGPLGELHVLVLFGRAEPQHVLVLTTCYQLEPEEPIPWSLALVAQVRFERYPV